MATTTVSSQDGVVVTVKREEFDALVARVASIEDRSASQFGYIFVELHKINEKLASHEEEFDNIDRKLDVIIGRLE